jgi:MFS family permease
MTTRITKTDAPPVRPDRLSSLVRLWPWALLAIAAIVFVVRFVPGYFLASMDTETIVLPLFYQDVIVAHHPSANWAWGGFSALFPDVLIFFGLNYLVTDGALALQLLQMCFFAGWLGATVGLVVELNRPHKLGLLSILLVLWVGLVFNFGLPDNWGIVIERSLLQPVYHSGSGVMTAICLVLLLHLIGRGWGISFWWLFVLSFLASASDTLFDAIFLGPALVTLVLLAIAFRSGWKWYLTVAANLAIAGVAAYLLGPYLFPPSLQTGYYLQISWGHICSAYASIHDEALAPEHHLFAFILTLDILTVLGGIGGLLFFCLSPRRRSISAIVFSLMVFCSCCIFANWSAVIATGDYVNINANRYTTVALMIPLFLLAFGLHAVVIWRRWLEILFALAAGIFALAVSFIPQEHSYQYDGVMEDIPFLKKVMAEHDIHACLGSYWCGNIVTFLSHGQVPVRSLGCDGKIYSWFNSLEWFGKGHPMHEWPRYRLIYGPDSGCADAFGKPDEILKAPSNADVWLYSEARAIRYNPYFDSLSNSLLDDGRTLRLNAGGLPGGSHIDGTARTCTNGEEEGWFVYGPYLVLSPGHYRATFHYTFSVLPAINRGPTYDLDVHAGKIEHSYDGMLLPCPNTEPQSFADTFTVTQPGQQYEMRIFYHGSGTLRVESLDLTYLDN